MDIDSPHRKGPIKMVVRKPAEKVEETAVEKRADNSVSTQTFQRFTDADLRMIKSAEDAMRFATEQAGLVESIADELGTGFVVLEDKDTLVGTSFVILFFDFLEGDFGEFATMFIVTTNEKPERRLIVNDGSTGIYHQLQELAKKRNVGWAVPRGLSMSDYATCPPKDGGCGKARTERMTVCRHCGNESVQRGTGVTFYLDTTPV